VENAGVRPRGRAGDHTATLPGAVRQPALSDPIAWAPRRSNEQVPGALLPLAPLPEAVPVAETPRRAAGHNLLWMAAMRAIPLLPEVAAVLARTPPAPASAAPPAEPMRPRPSRWSGDGWLAWRPGSSAPLGPGAITPVYGGSQAGAILRYELAPGSRRRPAGYVRVVQALGGRREGDLAAGLALRPLAGMPVTAHGEARLSRRGAALEVRPAAFLSGGVEAAPLAAGFAARGYAQAGYVGGRDATAFADGSLIADRPVWRDRETALSAGGGVWGGAQRGAARLDLGPSASLRFRLGEGTARLSADYRLRIAGNAEPAAGAALTLSAGF